MSSHEPGTFGQLSSHIASLSVYEDGPWPSTPYPDSHQSWMTELDSPSPNVSSLCQQRSPSSIKKKTLPALVLQLLDSLCKGQSKSSEILAVYNHVLQQCQEEALVDISFNPVVAKALVSLQG
jgi:hypothetical protein